ncbi:MAG: hypothetical protein AAGA17_03170 [Actinomycetota bacterium]
MQVSAGVDGLHTRIERTLGSLGPAGRRVTTAILADVDRLGFLTAAQIGRLAGTTDATVVRTVQRLGYDGLADLKRSLLAELTAGDVASRYATAAEDVTGPSALDRHLGDATDALAGLTRPEIRSALVEAAAVLDAADRIVVAAAGPTAAIAEYAVAQWRRLGVDAAAATGPAGPGPDDLAHLDERTTVVLLASGRPRGWARTLIGTIAELDLAAVVLTDSLPAPSPRSIVVRSGRGPLDRPATHVATVAAVEAMTAALAELDPERTERALTRLTAARQRLGTG